MRELVQPYWNKLYYVYRMTHISNLPHILQNGLVHPNSQYAFTNYVSIGDKSIISVRQQQMVYGHKMTDFIPFYFGPRTPMLYVIQGGKNNVTQYNAEEIVYLVVKIEDLMKSNIDCVFSDGHAVTAITEFYMKSELVNVDKYVHVEDVYAKYWKEDSDLDLKRKKEAELLCLDEVPKEIIAGFVVYNDNAKQIVCSFGVDESKVKVFPDYYF